MLWEMPDWQVPGGAIRKGIITTMTGAMYAAVSGMKTHMQKLNVIGNNVANVNTYGYKAGRTTFMESLYTSVRSGSNGTTALGGNNPSQIGYGCKIGTIDLDMSTKNYVPTGQGLDAMINGDGFFMVGDKNGVTSPDALELTRVGNFQFIDGYLVDGQGRVVYGFLSANAAAEGGASADYAGPAGSTPGVSTELVPIRLPLSAKAPATGETHQEGTALYPGVTDTGKTQDATGALVNTDGKRVQLDSVSIDKTGKIVGINKATKETVVVGYVAIGSPDNPGGVTHIEGPYYKAMGGAGDLRVASIGNVVKGNLNNKAADATDLKANDAILGTGQTELVPNGLESSGTDIATEFSEMISTQRGYQANTRIITVTDSMLEELVNIKR